VLVRVVEPRWFGPPLSRPEQLTLRTPPTALDVQALPPAPPGFAGAVGQLALSARLEPARLHLGEAATLTVTLAGQGNGRGVGVPDGTPRQGVEILPPQQQGEEKVAGTVVQGTRTWSWAVVPRQTGETTLRVPEIPFFDPQAGQYKTASVPPVTLTTLSPAGSENNATSASVLRSLQSPSAGALRDRAIAWRRLLPWLPSVPCGTGLSFLARPRPHPSAAAASARSPGAPAAFAAADNALREAAEETRPRQAACRIEEAWRGFLSRRWGVPSCTPAPGWWEAVRSRGGDLEAVDELRRLAGDLHYLRHAPQLPTTPQPSTTEAPATEALARSHRLLRRLR